MKYLQKTAFMAVGVLAALATVTSAMFTDVAEIADLEAPSVLSATQIMVGDDLGAFRPNDDVTRAEMAKMIVTLVGLAPEGTTEFEDCQGFWAEGYIAQAVEAGFVSGDGDGNFRPNGSVTGLEAAKMLLVALDYDGTAYVGADWQATVLADCRTAGLGNTLDLTTNLTRQQAAQLLLDGLEATVFNSDATLYNVYFPTLTKDDDTWRLGSDVIYTFPEEETEEEDDDDDETEEVETVETDDLLFTDGVITGTLKWEDGDIYNVYRCYINGEASVGDIKSKNDYAGNPQFYGGSYDADGAFIIETLKKDETGNDEERVHDTQLTVSSIVNNRWMAFTEGGGVFAAGTVEFDTTSAKVCDLTDSGLTSVKKMTEAMNEGTIVASVIGNSENNTISYIYITDYIV